MIEILQSAFLGVVQGITEFLPISSSAHLFLIPSLFGWRNIGLAFDTALHFGTALAIIIFFWRDWVKIILSGFNKKIDSPYPKNTLWQIAAATIPAVIAGLFIEDIIEKYFHADSADTFALTVTATGLVVFGFVLWITDKYARQDLSLSKITYKKSFLIGLAQCLALIPGVSRSGITMVASRALGLKREDAARYSFLLGTPASLGAFVWQARKIDPSMLDTAFFVGVILSAIAGILTIKYLLAFLRRSDFSIFAWYRFVLAIIVFAVVFFGTR